jgi:sugar O-acyltransferase (sialic acid O-acetyltransferase NeuD family)
VSATEQIVLVGGGGHAREIVQILRDVIGGGGAVTLLGVLADGYWDEDGLVGAGTARIGPVSSLDQLDASYVIAIGDGSARDAIDTVARTTKARAARALVHPSATVGSTVNLEAGVVVFPGVRLTTDVSLGRHVHVNVNSTVSHDCVLGEYVTLAPGCTLAGRVTVGARSTIGSGAIILPRVQIGADAVVGAGAVVTKDVGDGEVVAGVPARVLRTR